MRLLSLVFYLIYATVGTSPALAEQEPARVIAVGDLHGDWQAYEAILQAAGLIDARLKWIGGTSVFVQTGDVVDRGPDSYRIIKHLKELKRQAKKAGGRVITLVGNHEAMNRVGDIRYVHAGEFNAFTSKRSEAARLRFFKDNRKAINRLYKIRYPNIKRRDVFDHWAGKTPLGMLEHKKAWTDKGVLGKWVLDNPAVVKIAGTIFVHGGLSGKYADTPLDEINKAVRTALRKGDDGETSILYERVGPLWYRDYVYSKDKTVTRAQRQQELETVLAGQQAQRMVIGHTPSRKGIRDRFGGRLIQIDTGASAYYGGTRSFLRIEQGKVFAHDGANVRELPGGQS